MSNLRPAPAALTPQRVDALFAALNARDRAHVEITLRRLSLSDADIEAVFHVAHQIDRSPLETAGVLVSAGIEALGPRR
ncbi:MAG: hypothetical protein HEQ22_03235 [Sphingopyxis sp.]|uniref:hypothetical protein n=1 Tax=Sphingopyxis sp. TaxID=1908224 RepID=UPI003D80D33E